MWHEPVCVSVSAGFHDGKSGLPECVEIVVDVPARKSGLFHESVYAVARAGGKQLHQAQQFGYFGQFHDDEAVCLIVPVFLLPALVVGAYAKLGNFTVIRVIP